jgi:hypothetical protein
VPNELEKIISSMSNAEKAQFEEKTRLAMLLLMRVTPHISGTAKLIEEQRDEEKSTKRIWTGLWIIMGAILLLDFINVADEKWFYYPGVFIAAIFIRQWLSPISRFDFEIANLEAHAFPVLIRLEELGLRPSTIFSWILTTADEVDRDWLCECQGRYCGRDEPLLGEALHDSDSAVSMSNFDDDDFTEDDSATEEDVWFRARLEIARQLHQAKNQGHE